MKPLNEMTQEELFEFWKYNTAEKTRRQNEINRRLLDRSAETLQLVKRICQHLGVIHGTRDET